MSEVDLSDEESKETDQDFDALARLKQRPKAVAGSEHSRRGAIMRKTVNMVQLPSEQNRLDQMARASEQLNSRLDGPLQSEFEKLDESSSDISRTHGAADRNTFFFIRRPSDKYMEDKSLNENHEHLEAMQASCASYNSDVFNDLQVISSSKLPEFDAIL